MTDLEMTKLCAEAAGYRTVIAAGQLAVTELPTRLLEFGGKPEIHYDPLHDDAQAMVLVKKFRLHIVDAVDRWRVMAPPPWSTAVSNIDLNRAIVECVAKMQLESAAKAGVSGPRDQIRQRE